MSDWTCSNCRFWKHEYGLEEGEGYCRRRAPGAFFADGRPNTLYRWPVTAATDFCGEHEPELDQ